MPREIGMEFEDFLPSSYNVHMGLMSTAKKRKEAAVDAQAASAANPNLRKRKPIVELVQQVPIP
jgi:hypothetical protein